MPIGTALAIHIHVVGKGDDDEIVDGRPQGADSPANMTRTDPTG
jgi:hypothetical protein